MYGRPDTPHRKAQALTDFFGERTCLIVAVTGRAGNLGASALTETIPLETIPLEIIPLIGLSEHIRQINGAERVVLGTHPERFVGPLHHSQSLDLALVHLERGLVRSRVRVRFWLGFGSGSRLG